MTGRFQEGEAERKLGRTVWDCAGFSAGSSGREDRRFASTRLPHRGGGQNGCPLTGTAAESGVHAEVETSGGGRGPGEHEISC
jgi:hypothetical protein